MTATLAGPFITEPNVYDIPESTIHIGDGHLAIVDPDNYYDLLTYEWRPLYGHNDKIYVTAQEFRRTVYMHRIVAETPAGMETDHINGNGLDNRRINLRTATASQNSANTGKPRRPDGSAHTSRYKGVSWDRARSKWQAKIGCQDEVTGLTRTRNLGRYLDEEDAARAYDVAAIRQWGEFALINFPEVSA